MLALIGHLLMSRAPCEAPAVYSLPGETTKSRSRPAPWTDTCRVRKELVLNGPSRASIRAGAAGPGWPQETHVPERKTSKRASEEGRTKPAGRGCRGRLVRSAGSDRHEGHTAEELGAGPGQRRRVGRRRRSTLGPTGHCHTPPAGMCSPSPCPGI